MSDFGPVMMSINGSEPFEVGELTMVWEPVDGVGPAIPAGTLTLEPLSFTVSGEMYGWFEQLLHDSPGAQERRAAEHRRLWSGPDRFDQQLLRAYRLPWRALGLVPRSAFSSGYRRRQWARVKRRRR